MFVGKDAIQDVVRAVGPVARAKPAQILGLLQAAGHQLHGLVSVQTPLFGHVQGIVLQAFPEFKHPALPFIFPGGLPGFRRNTTTMHEKRTGLGREGQDLFERHANVMPWMLCFVGPSADVREHANMWTNYHKQK